MQDRAECAAKDPPPAHSAVPGSVHAEETLHDCDRIPAWRLHVRPVQAGQLWQGGSSHPEEGSGIGLGLCTRHAVSALQKVSCPPLLLHIQADLLTHLQSRIKAHNIRCCSLKLTARGTRGKLRNIAGEDFRRPGQMTQWVTVILGDGGNLHRWLSNFSAAVKT